MNPHCKPAYLATPYSKFPAQLGGIEGAFIEASKLAATLMCSGVNVYSPIAHMHPLAIHGNLDPLDHTIWLPANQAMMNVCDTLIVAKMEGWESSYGIEHELKWYREQGRAVYWLDPETMIMTRERPLPPPRDRHEGLSPEQIREMTNSYLDPKPPVTDDSQVVRSPLMTPKQQTIIADAKARIAELDKQIAEYPHWGAAITALDEERKELLNTLRSMGVSE